MIAAHWLAHQYTKRAVLREAPARAARGDFLALAQDLSSIAAFSRALAAAWQARWDANRYPEDKAPLPTQMLKEADLFSAEVDELEAAAGGQPYAGQLLRPILAIHMVNSHPACR